MANPFLVNNFKAYGESRKELETCTDEDRQDVLERHMEDLGYIMVSRIKSHAYLTNPARAIEEILEAIKESGIEV